MSKTKLDIGSEQNILNMLMDGSVISAEQMTRINNTSSEIGKTKLETAFELNIVDEDKILKILSATYSLPAVNLSKKVIDPKIKKIIDLRYIRENLLVPFEMGEGVIKIAIADASKLGLMKNLKTMTKMEPELYATSISEINNFIERIENQKGRSRDLPELLDAESLECGDEDVLHTSNHLCRANGNKVRSVQCGLAFDENGRNQREYGARNGHPNGKISHALSGALWKPRRIV